MIPLVPSSSTVLGFTETHNWFQHSFWKLPSPLISCFKQIFYMQKICQPQNPEIKLIITCLLSDLNSVLLPPLFPCPRSFPSLESQRYLLNERATDLSGLSTVSSSVSNFSRYRSFAETKWKVLKRLKYRTILVIRFPSLCHAEIQIQISEIVGKGFHTQDFQFH